MVYLNGAGWLSDVSEAESSEKGDSDGETGEEETTMPQVIENLPDGPVGVINLGFDHISRPINIFPDVKHRQRHGTSYP